MLKPKLVSDFYFRLKVIQRRRDGSVDFNRSWSEYQEGFGDLEGEFWWGNEKLRTLTDTEVSTWELVVDLEAFDGDVGRVRYGNFSVTGELYDLTVEDFDSLNDEGNFKRLHPISGDFVVAKERKIG